MVRRTHLPVFPFVISRLFPFAAAERSMSPFPGSHDLAPPFVLPHSACAHCHFPLTALFLFSFLLRTISGVLGRGFPKSYRCKPFFSVSHGRVCCLLLPVPIGFFLTRAFPPFSTFPALICGVYFSRSPLDKVRTFFPSRFFFLNDVSTSSLFLFSHFLKVFLGPPLKFSGSLFPFSFPELRDDMWLCCVDHRLPFLFRVLADRFLPPVGLKKTFSFPRCEPSFTFSPFFFFFLPKTGETVPAPWDCLLLFCYFGSYLPHSSPTLFGQFLVAQPFLVRT